MAGPEPKEKSADPHNYEWRYRSQGEVRHLCDAPPENKLMYHCSHPLVLPRSAVHVELFRLERHLSLPVHTIVFFFSFQVHYFRSSNLFEIFLLDFVMLSYLFMQQR